MADTQHAKQRINVPDTLRDILLEFSITFLLEQPDDVIDYAVEFFTRLQEKRNAERRSQELPSPDESVMSTDDGECSIVVSKYNITWIMRDVNAK